MGDCCVNPKVQEITRRLIVVNQKEGNPRRLIGVNQDQEITRRVIVV